MKTICFFGIYDPEYSRNRVLKEGFKQNGWNILECRVDPEKYKGFSKYRELIKLCSEIKKENIKPYILVAFPGHTIVWLARILFLRNIIFFDAFLSRFDSNVHDRKVYKSFSIKGIMDWFLDFYSCLLSDKVILDTNQHIDYFSKKFFVSKNKMIRIPVSTDTKIFYPQESKKQTDKFIVYFQGMFIPLQGIKYIIEAAEVLKDNKDIIFNIVGSGQQYKEIEKTIKSKNLTNVFLLGKKKLFELPEYIAQADICLGIFGDTEKTKRVIPNKVYEYVAMKKAIITADTPAIREFFVNERDMLLCKHSDGHDIARSIIMLKDNPKLVLSLAENSYNNFIDNFKPSKIIHELINYTL